MVELLAQTLLNALVASLTLVLIALGLSLIFGIMNIVNFAHGEIYMLGAFGVWLLFGRVTLPGPTVFRYFLALVITAILISIMGIILERFFFRASRGKLLQSFIISLALIFILQSSAAVIFGPEDKSAPSPFVGVLKFGGVVLSKERVIVILICLALIFLVNVFIFSTKGGRAMRAVAQEADAAALQGISINTVHSLTMAIGCALAACAGAILGPIFYVNPYIGSVPILKAFAVIILGGMGSVPGTIVGGFVIGFVESFGSTYLGAELAVMLVFIVLILVLLIKPTGLFGHV